MLQCIEHVTKTLDPLPRGSITKIQYSEQYSVQYNKLYIVVFSTAKVYEVSIHLFGCY